MIDRGRRGPCIDKRAQAETESDQRHGGDAEGE
jgi:hypothetical protein